MTEIAVIEKVSDRYGANFTHVDATLRVYNCYVPKVGDAFVLKPASNVDLIDKLDEYLQGCPDPDAVGSKWINASSRLLWECRKVLLAREGIPARKVGCEGTDGLLRVHLESETCEVCKDLTPPE